MPTKQLGFGFPIPDGHQLVFRATITTRNGRVLHAKWFGIRGFPILIRTA